MGRRATEYYEFNRNILRFRNLLYLTAGASPRPTGLS